MFMFFVLIGFQSDYVSCDHILSAFAAHKLNAQLYRQTATADGLVMYHAATIRVLHCFAVPNAKNVNHVVLY